MSGFIKANISDLTPDPRNANKGTQRGRGMLDKSLRQYGAGRSILLDKHNRIIAGNKTTEAAADIGLNDVMIVESDGTQLIAVKRTDLDLDDAAARELAYADNRVAQVDLDWDATQMLQDAAAGVDLDKFFLKDELDEMLGRAVGGDADAEPQIDRAEELNKKWQVQRGDLWRIGEHRLLCGDSKISAEVERVVCGDSVAFVSDVPYGIDVDTSWLSALHVQRGKPPNKNDDKLANDDGTLDLSWAYKFKEWLVFGFPFVARDEEYTGLLVWDKRGDGGENGLGNPVEVAASNAFNGYRLARHIWAGYVREAGEKREDHPTQKPLGIMLDAIKLVKNQIILDPFVGSGTTLVACQNLQRKCRAIEISPNYCAVILERMATAFPGIEIEKLVP